LSGMLKLGRHIRGFSRLMTGLFAVQVLAAGFCLLTPQSHAANAQPATMQMQSSSSGMAGMASHCKNDSDSDHKPTSNQHSSCAHCDQPDELIQSKVSPFNIDFDLPLQPVAVLAIELPVQVTVDLAVRTPTGPPRSSSLIYTTTQRIRV